jgi:hypothetical protein
MSNATLMQQTGARALEPTYQDQEKWNNMNQTDHPVEGFLRRNAPQLGQRMPDRGQTAAGQFANVIEKGDPRDERYALRGQLLGPSGNPVLPGVGMAMATDSDFEYFHKKALDAQEADFKAWFLAQMDLSTPEKQAYWQSQFPEVFQEKQRLLESQVDIQLRLAKIRMLGPKNKEDYMLLWAIQRGFIKLPAGPLYDPSKQAVKEFHEGLFNIKKLFARSGKGEYGLWDGTKRNGGPADATLNANVNFSDPLSNTAQSVTQRYDGIVNFANIGYSGGGYKPIL